MKIKEEYRGDHGTRHFCMEKLPTGRHGCAQMKCVPSNLLILTGSYGRVDRGLVAGLAGLGNMRKVHLAKVEWDVNYEQSRSR